MNRAELKSIWKKEEKTAYIKGWDFSHIHGRYEEENDLPWDYEKIVRQYLTDTAKVLDYDTGGGEFLLSLNHPFARTAATEGFEPNVRLCQEKLLPLGIDFKECNTPSRIPYDNETFDMIICRNITWTLDDPQKAYKEWLRVLKKGGRLLVSDACWYLHLYDEEKKKIYEAHDAAMWEKYGRGIHAHEDAETGKELSSKLFMSDKKRPAWDLDHMMEIGFSKVFALKDISDISRTSMDRELNKLTPQFLVGGEE